MINNIKEINILRKKLGLTQSQLAKKANVSQSLIAKIEAGKLDPTFSKAQQIFQTLQEISEKDELKIKDIMTKKLITAVPTDKICDIIRVMKQYKISQMPVIEGDNCVGMISESAILDSIIDGKGEIVEDVMREAPPIINNNSSISIVSPLLKHYPMVLFFEKGKLMGVITKSDLINKVYSR